MQYLLYEENDGIGTLTINNPRALNTLSVPLIKELEQAVQDILDDGRIGALILTGAGGRAFAAGADLSEMMAFSPAQTKEYSEFGNRVFRMIETLPMPVIAAISGYALGGGCELAMSADIRYAAAGAVFGQPEAAFGITPGFGGTQRLSRIVGRSTAKELILTGRKIDAQEAKIMGLVSAVVEENELMPLAVKTAKMIAELPVQAVRSCKRAIDEGFEKNIEEALRLESEIFAACFETDEPKRLMGEFVNRRKK